jgi:hypothetical protein
VVYGKPIKFNSTADYKEEKERCRRWKNYLVYV